MNEEAVAVVVAAATVAARGRAPLFEPFHVLRSGTADRTTLTELPAPVAMATRALLGDESTLMG